MQTSLLVMITLGAISLVIGTLVGSIAGYYRGRADTFLMRGTDLVITLPVIVLGLAVHDLPAVRDLAPDFEGVDFAAVVPPIGYTVGFRSSGVRVLLTHYAPGSKEGLGRWTPASRLAELAGQTDARVVVCGHTHSPFVREAGGVLFVNPGSAGPRRFTLPISIAELIVDGTRVSVRLVDLEAQAG